MSWWRRAYPFVIWTLVVVFSWLKKVEALETNKLNIKLNRSDEPSERRKRNYSGGNYGKLIIFFFDFQLHIWVLMDKVLYKYHGFFWRTRRDAKSQNLKWLPQKNSRPDSFVFSIAKCFNFYASKSVTITPRRRIQHWPFLCYWLTAVDCQNYRQE